MSTAAATVKVVTVSSPKGDTEVHAPGCADLKKKAKGYHDACTWNVATAVQLSHDFWSDQISDEVDPDSPEGWATAESWVGTFHFMPCCPAFPGDQPNTVRMDAVDTAKSTPAVPTASARVKGISRSAEARRRIMDRKYSEGYQAAMEDIRVALETAGEAAVVEWLKNNTTK